MNYLTENFKDKETKNKFTGFYDAQTATDNVVDLSLSDISTKKISHILLTRQTSNKNIYSHTQLLFDCKLSYNFSPQWEQ